MTDTQDTRAMNIWQKVCPVCKGDRAMVAHCQACNRTGIDQIGTNEELRKEIDKVRSMIKEQGESQLLIDQREPCTRDVHEILNKRIAELEDENTHLKEQLIMANENARFHRANAEKHEDGSVSICWGDHEKGEKCDYARYVPEQPISVMKPCKIGWVAWGGGGSGGGSTT